MRFVLHWDAPIAKAHAASWFELESENQLGRGEFAALNVQSENGGKVPPHGVNHVA
jgi:hypothetical protein